LPPPLQGDHLVDGVLVPGEDPGDEAVGYALDEVPANLAAHQGAHFVGLDDDARQDQLRSRKH
jgi:hypothetical protein